MDTRNSQSGIGITGRIDAHIYDADELEAAHPSWDSMSKKEKLQATRSVDPEETQVTYNTTVDGLHEYIVDNLDPDNSAAEANVSADYLGLGDDDATAPQTSNTDLNNRVYSETVTDHADNGSSLLCSTFVDSTEANGNTINEVGIFTGDPTNLGNADVFLLNHSTITPITKDNSKTVVFDVTLTFSAA